MCIMCTHSICLTMMTVLIFLGLQRLHHPITASLLKISIPRSAAASRRSDCTTKRASSCSQADASTTKFSKILQLFSTEVLFVLLFIPSGMKCPVYLSILMSAGLMICHFRSLLFQLFVASFYLIMMQKVQNF